MINKSINKYYEITIQYWTTGLKELKQIKFVSDFSFTSKKFKKCLDEYMRKVTDFERYDEEWGSQFTVSNSCYPDYKDKLHEGMTDDRYFLALKSERTDNAYKINKAYNYLVRRLKEQDCTLQVYKAKTTSSCYIKIDNGVGGSIRISDHKGKSHLSYTYNLIMGSALRANTVMGNTRWYAPFNEIETLLTKIIEQRNIRIRKYGSMYSEFMKNNRDNNKGKSFWKLAEYAHKGRYYYGTAEATAPYKIGFQDKRAKESRE